MNDFKERLKANVPNKPVPVRVKGDNLYEVFRPTEGWILVSLERLTPSELDFLSECRKPICEPKEQEPKEPTQEQLEAFWRNL